MPLFCLSGYPPGAETGDPAAPVPGCRGRCSPPNTRVLADPVARADSVMCTCIPGSLPPERDCCLLNQPLPVPDSALAFPEATPSSNCEVRGARCEVRGAGCGLEYGKGLDLLQNMYYVVHMTFGAYIRQCREILRAGDRKYSLRQVAQRIGVEPAYLSKIERDEVAPPSEAKIRALAQDLNEDADVLLAMAGKVSTDLLEIIRKRPQLFADLIRELKTMPDHAILRIARDVRDGEW